MRKISKIKSCLKNVFVEHKTFLLFVFLSLPFGRRESRITLCQPEKYFLCLSSPSSKPKIINYSHSFGLLLFDCGLLLWRAFRNVPPGKFGLCGSRCCFWGGPLPWCLNLPWVRFYFVPVPCLALLPPDRGWHLGFAAVLEADCAVPSTVPSRKVADDFSSPVSSQLRQGHHPLLLMATGGPSPSGVAHGFMQTVPQAE